MNQGLVERIDAVFALDPARGAIEFGGRWWSWGQMDRVSRAVRELLAGAGLGEGSVIGMLIRNRPLHLPAAIGILNSARCLAAVNPFQSEQRIAEDILSLRPRALIADAEDWVSPVLHAAAQQAGCLGISLKWQDVSGVNGNDHAATLCEVTLVPGLERAGPGPHHEALPGVAMLMLSSGTTGAPKRVKLDFRNFERAVLDVAFYEAGSGNSQLTLKNSVAFATLPLVHIGGIWTALLNFAMGRALVMFEKFSVEECRAAILRHRPKLIALPPTALRMIYDAGVPREDLSSLIAIRGGSAPLDPAFAEAWEERYGIPILDSYGATEFGGGVAGWTWPDYQKYGRAKRGSVGRANKGCSIRIVDVETGAPLPPGRIGLLQVKAPQVGNGDWTQTTDLGEIDEDGFIYIRGRSDGAIIRGGFKILPDEVVDVLRAHPAVKDACVVGIPDDRLGAVPVAAVELRSSAARISGDDLIAFARSRMVAYKVPVEVRVVDTLPRTPSMKVSQFDVKSLFLEARDSVAS